MRKDNFRMEKISARNRGERSHLSVLLNLLLLFAFKKELVSRNPQRNYSRKPEVLVFGCFLWQGRSCGSIKGNEELLDSIELSR